MCKCVYVVVVFLFCVYLKGYVMTPNPKPPPSFILLCVYIISPEFLFRGGQKVQVLFLGALLIFLTFHRNTRVVFHNIGTILRNFIPVHHVPPYFRERVGRRTTKINKRTKKMVEDNTTSSTKRTHKSYSNRIDVCK